MKEIRLENEAGAFPRLKDCGRPRIQEIRDDSVLVWNLPVGPRPKRLIIPLPLPLSCKEVDKQVDDNDHSSSDSDGFTPLEAEIIFRGFVQSFCGRRLSRQEFEDMEDIRWERGDAFFTLIRKYISRKCPF